MTPAFAKKAVVLLAAVCMGLPVVMGQPKVRARMGVRIPMRDGTKLAADIYVPAGVGRYPGIFELTPYIRTGINTSRTQWRYWTERGYAFLLVDVRGRGDSEGTFEFFHNDINDGYDVVEWIAAQPWSSGKVGMIGGSYTGTNQWYAARNQPPHLSCITPTATLGDFFAEIPYQGGAFRLEWNLNWNMSTSDHMYGAPLLVNWRTMLSHRPLQTADEAAGRRMAMYQRFIGHPTLDSYWKRVQFTEADFRKIAIPALAFSGWYDGTLPGTVFYYQGMKRHSPAADRQYIVLGPWNHGTAAGGGYSYEGKPVTRMGDLEFPNASLLPGVEMTRSFFDWCLKDGPEFKQASAKIYITGSDRWLDLPSYPPPQMQVRPLYLHSGGKANTLNGDGTLAWDAPQNEVPDQFVYDPANPVPSGIEGKAKPPGNPVDSISLESRPDMLIYTTALLKESVTIAGRVILVLHAASDARDTDFTGNILDVYPDGRVIKLGPKIGGSVRARYRNGYEREELLTPNQPAEFKIDLFDIGHTFLPGHRIRLEVSSSAYPWISANPNTGNPIATDTETPRVARQRVFHETARPSHILMPVIPLP